MTVIKSLPYQELPGSHEKHKLDIHLPPDIKDKEGLTPVVVHVHGGGWQRGDKSNLFYGGPFIGAAMAKRGFICVVVGYRVGNAFPDPILDVAAAVKWTLANIQKYGGDPNRLFLSGHSAGAHLASLLVCTAKYMNKHEIPHDAIKGVMCISGIYTVGNPFSETESLQTMFYRKFYVNPTFGNDPKIWNKASPIHHITKRDDSGKPFHNVPPFCIFNATVDLSLNHDGQKFHTILNQKGITAQYHTLFGTHGTITRTNPVADICEKFIKEIIEKM